MLKAGTQTVRLTEMMGLLLDLHLARVIRRYKPEDRMSKFTELAEAIESDLKNWDQQADELSARREKNRLRGEAIFAKHRDKQGEVETGLARMEQAISALEGSNSKNEQEGSGGSSEVSFSKT